MKIFKRIITTIIWTVLIIYLMLIFALRFDSVQETIGNYTAKIIGNKLSTKVEVGRIDLGILNRIIIDDLTIYDHQGKKIIQSARLTSKINIAALTKGIIDISSAQIFGTNILLYKSSAESKPNFQFIIDALSSKEKTADTPLDLSINSLIIRHCNVRYDQYDKINTPGKLNGNHLAINKINGHILLKKLTNDSININIKKFSLVEQSGFTLNRLSLNLEANKSCALLTNFYMKLPNTKIKSDQIEAHYTTDKSMNIVDGSMTYTATLKTSFITPSDFACVAPQLKDLNQTININANAHGTDRQSVIDNIDISAPTIGANLKALVRIYHPRNQKPTIDTYLQNASISLQAVDQVVNDLSKGEKKLPQELTNIGQVNINGHIKSTISKLLNVNLNILTDAGKATINGTWTSNGMVNGNLTVDDANLKTILGNEHFGMANATINLNGNLDNIKSPIMNVSGKIAKIEYNNHVFNDIELSVNHTAKNIHGTIGINNPDIAFNINGELSKSGKQNNIKIKGDIETINPYHLKLTDKYPNTIFNAHLDADITGNNINDVCGTINVNNLNMISLNDYYHLNSLRIKSGYNADKYYIGLTSDFGAVNVSGHYNYASIHKSFIKILKKHLPTMPGLPSTIPQTSNDIEMSANITHSDWLQKLFGINIGLEKPVTLKGIIKDKEGIIAIDADARSFTINDKPYRDAALHISTDNSINPTDGSTLQTTLDITKLMDNGQSFDCHVDAYAANNNLETTLSWDNNLDSLQKINGVINAVSRFHTTANGQQTANINITPSYIDMKGTQWYVAPSQIIYRKNLLTVNKFSISHDDQHLIINGCASKNSDDTLNIELCDIDVQYILDLVNFHSVDFSGLASGHAYIKAPFGTLAAQADLKVKQFEFEHGHMGILNATAVWNQTKKQIDIHGICNDGPDAMTFINGYVSPQPGFIDLDIRAAGTYIDFMQSFTNSFAEGMTGRAKGQVKLSGPLSTINLSGQLVVDAEAHINALNCKYYLHNDTITFVPDNIILRNATVYDKFNNKGYLSGELHHKHLTRLSYDLYVKAENLLGYDFNDFGDSSFYGTVFATGDVGIHGKSGELRINVNCTPQRNTVFTYNASSPDAITNQEFIRWNDITNKKSNSNTQQSDSKIPISKESPNTHSTHHNALSSDVYINFLINCTPDATVRLLMDSHTNDYITLNGNGTLRASYYNKGAFKMFGTYLIDHGTYGITIQNILKKNFVFNNGGTITFGGEPYDAALNMQAVHTVYGVYLSDLSASSTFFGQRNTTKVDCLMNINGTPNTPRVTFDIDMPTMDADEKRMVNSLISTEEEKQQQVLYLLGIGRFYPQEANNSANTSQMSQTTLAMQSLLSGTISSQINSLLGNVLKSNNWNFGTNISTGDEGWNNAEYEGLINGRMLDNRLQFNGEFGYRDNTRTANTSFIGDFNIQYMLVPSGNLALKVYNETNDRYFTKSSLNTQGIGLIMKRDFTNWRDFIKRTRKKKK